MSQRLRVAVEAPQHSGLSAPLDYLSEQPIAPGSLVRVVNALGQPVAEFRAANPTATLQVAEWPRGIYFVRTEASEALRVVKP